MATSRGRGLLRTDSANAQALRRPGEAGLIQRFVKLSAVPSKVSILFPQKKIYTY